MGAGLQYPGIRIGQVTDASMRAALGDLDKALRSLYNHFNTTVTTGPTTGSLHVKRPIVVPELSMSPTSRSTFGRTGELGRVGPDVFMKTGNDGEDTDWLPITGLTAKADKVTLMIAGAGLTGGGSLAANRTFNVGAGTGVIVDANTVGIADTAVTPGTYTLSTITVDQQGRLTSAATGVVTVPTGADTTASVGPAAINGVAATFMRSDAAPKLADTAVAPGSFTYASITVDQQGRLTAASSGTAPASAANPSASVGLAAVNGSAATFMRSDGAPALSVAIVPTWSGIHTFSAQDVHTLGVSLSTSGLITADVANSAGNKGCLIQNTVKLTGSKPVFEVDWYSGSAQQALFTLWGTGAGGATLKEMRLYYDASNYFASTVNSTGQASFTATGTSTRVDFNANIVKFTATTQVDFATATINVGVVSAPAVVLYDGTTISNSANVTGTKIGAASDKLGFFGVSPVVRPGAFTQTYSTASHTHSNPTATTLTDNTAGTANTTLEALASGTLYATDVAAIRNNFADLAAAVNALIADLANVKQVVNGIIDDGQSTGLLQ